MGKIEKLHSKYYLSLYSRADSTLAVKGEDTISIEVWMIS
jgi:hypothetical protein